MKTALVLGAGGFIGSHLVKRLKNAGYTVTAADLKKPEFSPSPADEFLLGDLADPLFCAQVLNRSFDHVYQLAADMGGAGYIFSGEHDADLLHNSALINLNISRLCVIHKVGKVFYSSSACVYPVHNQQDPGNPICSEASAYPAEPDSEYGWEKLFSERLYLSYARNYALNVRIARFHNIFGPESPWKGGREKAPAAICRKVMEVTDGQAIEIWGNGLQTRSFLYIDDCLEGISRLMESNFEGPVNIGSEEMITINDFAKMVFRIAGKKALINNIAGPTGVNGRNSDNKLIKEKLGWAPDFPLEKGVQLTYKWIIDSEKSHK